MRYSNLAVTLAGMMLPAAASAHVGDHSDFGAMGEAIHNGAPIIVVALILVAAIVLWLRRVHRGEVLGHGLN